MFHKIFILSIIVLFQLPANGQIKEIKKLKEFNFKSIFGSYKSDSLNVYCLLGQGYFRTQRSENSDSIINHWITENPDASVIPVSSMEPAMTDEPESKMICCWIISKTDTLNLDLIRQGCFPGATMQKPTLGGMKPSLFGPFGLFENIRMRREYNKMMKAEKSKITSHIRKKDYKHFLEKLIQAENYAKAHKLGVWNEKAN